MRNQVLSIVALGIALAVLPAVSFAKGGGSGGGGGSHSSTGASSGSKTPYFGGGGGGHLGGGQNVNQKPKPGNGNKAGSKPVNCKAGGEGCYHQQ
jgi:hypothetical protein